MRVEEVPDEEPQQNGGVLDDRADALLVVDEEYGNTLKRGQVDTPEPRTQTKSVKDNVPNESNSNQATKGSTISPRDRKLQDRPIPQQQFDWYYDP